MNFLVKEALRLYPPTRRIYREILPALETNARVVAANIEACHRRTSIWGPDSDQFNPGRWINTTEEMRLAFMPFGSQPFVCPAKPEYAPGMIRLLVANLVRNISPQEWSLASSDDLELNIDLGDTPLIQFGLLMKTWSLSGGDLLEKNEEVEIPNEEKISILRLSDA